MGISQVLANGKNRALAGAPETNFFVEADGRFWRPADYVLNSTQACRHPQRHVLGSRTRMLRHVGSTPLLTTEAERCPAFHADRDSPRDQPCLAVMSTVPSLAISGCFSSSASHHSFARRVCSLSGPSSHWSPELSPVTQPMNGYGRPCSLHQLLNQIVPVQLRWKLPSKPLSTSSPTDVWQAPRTSVQNTSHCRKRPLLRLCRDELPDRRVRFVHRRELIPSLPSASR